MALSWRWNTSQFLDPGVGSIYPLHEGYKDSRVIPGQLEVPFGGLLEAVDEGYLKEAVIDDFERTCSWRMNLSLSGPTAMVTRHPLK